MKDFINFEVLFGISHLLLFCLILVSFWYQGRYEEKVRERIIKQKELKREWLKDMSQKDIIKNFQDILELDRKFQEKELELLKKYTGWGR